MLRLRVLLAVFAILSLASMPFGYMPDRGADGGFVLRICGGTMPMAHASGHEASNAAGAEAAGQAAGMRRHQGAHAKAADKTSDQPSTDAHEVRCNYAVPGLFAMPASAIPGDRILLPQADEPRVHNPLTGLFPPHLPPATGPPAV